MPQGKVSKWFDDRGFGFIRPDDGLDDLFFHVSAVRSGRVDRDDLVEFDTEISARTNKPQAIEVRVAR
jgi:cold shock CspA family protein